VSCILFVAELGSGFGHVRRLLPVARAATAAGAVPLFLVSNPEEVAPFTAAEGFAVERAPQPPAGANATQPLPGRVARSFADILGGAGFADRDRLLRTVTAWDATLAALHPVAVVAELSPFLALACLGADIPFLSLGHGFILPPPQLSQFPVLWNAPPLHDEQLLLDNAAAVCSIRGRPGPATLPVLLAGTAHAVTGFDVLDPYRTERRTPAVGPPGLDVDAPMEAEAAGEPTNDEDIFAYLLGDVPLTLPILQALAESGLRGRAFVRRGTEAHRRALCGSAVAWLDRPVPIRAALRRARAVVHHGSMLMTEESLVSGRVQMVAPLYLEHLLTARALLSLGVAHVLRPPHQPTAIADTLRRCLADTVLTARAHSFAENLRTSAPTRKALPEALLCQIGVGITDGTDSVAKGARC
jgi:hypothetical protein